MHQRTGVWLSTAACSLSIKRVPVGSLLLSLLHCTQACCSELGSPVLVIKDGNKLLCDICLAVLITEHF